MSWQTDNQVSSMSDLVCAMHVPWCLTGAPCNDLQKRTSA
jgi:hypothetical protein